LGIFKISKTILAASHHHYFRAVQPGNRFYGRERNSTIHLRVILIGFNKFPIKAHTSFKVENHGIVNGPLSRYSTLTGQQLDAIEKMAGETHIRVLNEVVRFE
jgi:hypothetical protein